MFGLNFLLGGGDGIDGKEKEEEEDDCKSQFFNFPHDPRNEGSSSERPSSPQQNSSFPLTFGMNGCDGQLGALEKNESSAKAKSLSHTYTSAFNFFEVEKKPDLNKILVKEPMENKMETDSCGAAGDVEFKPDVRNRENEAQVRSKSPVNITKPANLLSPWKNPVLRTMAPTLNGAGNDGRSKQLEAEGVMGKNLEPTVEAIIPNGTSGTVGSSMSSPVAIQYNVTPISKILDYRNHGESDTRMGKSDDRVDSTCTLKDASSASSAKNVRRNLFAGVTPRKLSEKNHLEETTATGFEDDEGEANFDSEIRGNPAQFVSFLRNQFGSTEEFGQFERYFYSQVEEVRMLRGNVEGLRGAIVKTQEEKRVLELQLVSERALRDQESKNALTDLEKNNMQLNTQIYSMKCEVETWKRKAEATLKESGWLKQQLRSLELEKTEAVRQLGELTRQHSGFEQYRISIEAYARRQREAMADIQKRVTDLETARETLANLTDHNQKQMNFMAVHLKNRESHRYNSEIRVGALEGDLIKARAELVQNNAKLVRVQASETKTTEIMDKLINENKDLHCGINVLVSTLQSNIENTNINFINQIEQIHEDVEASVQQLRIDDSCP